MAIVWGFGAPSGDFLAGLVRHRLDQHVEPGGRGPFGGPAWRSEAGRALHKVPGDLISDRREARPRRLERPITLEPRPTLASPGGVVRVEAVAWISGGVGRIRSPLPCSSSSSCSAPVAPTRSAGRRAPAPSAPASRRPDGQARLRPRAGDRGPLGCAGGRAVVPHRRCADVGQPGRRSDPDAAAPVRPPWWSARSSGRCSTPRSDWSRSPRGDGCTPSPRSRPSPA